MSAQDEHNGVEALVGDEGVDEDEIVLSSGDVFELGAERAPEEGEAAANERSPRRSPRYRRAMRLWEKREAQKLFLRVYRVTGDIGEACRNVDRALRTVEKWGQQDPAFLEAWKRVEQAIKVRMDRKLRSMDGLAAQVVEDTLRHSVDKRLRVEVALKLLRSHGHLVEETEVRHTGPGGGPVRIIHSVEVVRPPLGDAVIEGEVKELGEGTETERRSSHAL